MRFALFCRPALAMPLLAAATAHLCAADFTIRTTIYATTAPTDKTPVAENLTIFSQGRVYDEPNERPREASIFSPVEASITLLAPARQVKSVVQLDDLLKFVAALEVQAMRAGPLVRFAASPDFDATERLPDKQLTLKGAWMQYDVQAAEFPEEVVQSYRLFADWYARLNATRPGSLPPAARMELNRRLAERQWLPVEIRLTVRNEQTSSDLCSRHVLQPGLTEDDKKTIQRLEKYRQEFREVDLAEFRQLPGERAAGGG